MEMGKQSKHTHTVGGTIPNRAAKKNSTQIETEIPGHESAREMSKHQQSSMGKSGKSKQQHKHYFLFLMARFLFSGFLIPGGQGRWWYCDYDYDYDPLICFLLHVAINMLFYPSWRPAHPTYPVPFPLSTSTNRTPKQQVPYHTIPYYPYAGIDAGVGVAGRADSISDMSL